MRHLIIGGVLSVVLAQESPNSFISLNFGAAAPTGNFAASKTSFPTHGYANTGFILGGQLQTFVLPYFSLGFNAQFLTVPIKTQEIQKEGRLFVDPTEISSEVNYTFFLGGFGAGTGVRFNAFAFYVPIYLAFAALRIPEIRGDMAGGEYWTQKSTGALGIGFSTGVLVAIALTDDIGVTLNLLYHGLSAKEIEFTQEKYNHRGTLLQSRTLKASLSPQLSELGLGLQYYF